MPDGALPEPGGWNRPAFEVVDLVATVTRLTAAGHRFRNTIISGPAASRS